MNLLIVEDDTDLGRLATMTLDTEDVHVVAVLRSVNEATVWDGDWSSIDVVLTDYSMPGATGDVLLAWLAARWPHIRRVLMSAYGPALVRLDDADAFLRKPFSVESLLGALRGTDG